MQKDLFAENLGRAFADADNERFDLERLKRSHRRRNVRDKIIAGAGIVLGTLLTFYVMGIWVLSHLPEPV